ncbi:MAG: hypothetical protein AAF514_15655 [Verrucomicrobiota bacterium]
MSCRLSVSLLLALLVWVGGCSSAKLGQPVMINDPGMAAQLLGTRPVSLQWISWEDFGEVDVRKEKGVYLIEGGQKSRTNDDYLQIEGVITAIESDRFFFDGVIEIQVSHHNQGKPYRREGPQEFRLYGNRGFWRLANMYNPDASVDYVDIFFDLESARAPEGY